MTDKMQSAVSNQKGSAIIVVVLLVTILVALVVEFAYEVYIDTTSLSNWKNAQKASLIAKSGQALTTAFLKGVNNISYTSDQVVVFPVEKDFGPDSSLIIKIEDENAKFNINSIIRPNGATDDKALSSLKKLFEYLNINTNLALMIADWIDPDSEPRLSDSEDGAKNSFLWSVDELKLIPGIDEKIFEKISPLITVFGNNLININTAKLPVILSLSNDITESLAKRIIDYRESSPFEDKSHVQRVSGMESLGIQIIGRITVKSNSFRITARAMVNQITRIIESVSDTSMNIYFWREE
jgi:general secretion pathway protein K